MLAAAINLAEQSRPSDYFWKYQYHPTKRTDIINALLHFGFSEAYKDDVNTYFRRGENKVPVPNEEIIVSLPIYDIVQQIQRSRITEQEFLAVMNPEEVEIDGS